MRFNTLLTESTSGFPFKSFKNASVVLGLYDADGIKQEASASVNACGTREKTKFEAYSDCNAAKIKPATDLSTRSQTNRPRSVQRCPTSSLRTLLIRTYVL